MHGNDSLYTRMTTQPFYKENQIDPELEHKTKRVSDKLSETLNVIANEPSLAFFRIQEHVRKTLPQLVDQKHEVEDIQARVQGACFDAEYATNAIRCMQSSAIHFQNIQDLLKNAMFMKQQITYADKRRLGKASPVIPQSPEERKPQPEVEKESVGVMVQSTDSSLERSGCIQQD
ncbi:BLOC-1-related complex subunit 8-like isoform X2 [Physella acuta]|uniref:BLOC-1-related complex subunit 8-like isoform X2 n=1 Tax=Physella acuta TaxID=109671 RepID=UPI0027DB4847|nr:BLOC-1-related complex subunit 8-like isoform X2 [Physella acuta]